MIIDKYVEKRAHGILSTKFERKERDRLVDRKLETKLEHN